MSHSGDARVVQAVGSDWGGELGRKG